MYFTRPQREKLSQSQTKKSDKTASAETIQELFENWGIDKAEFQSNLAVFDVDTLLKNERIELPDRLAVDTAVLEMDYAVRSAGRTQFVKAQKVLENRGFFAEDALSNRSGLSMAVVFAKKNSPALTSTSQFFSDNQFFALTFSAVDDLMRTKSLISANFYEHHLLEDVAKEYQGNVIIDVGANVGNHSVFFANLCKQQASGRLYAFEPFPAAFDLLLKNLNENEVATVTSAQMVAVGEHKGFVKMNQGGEHNMGAAKVIQQSETDNIGTKMESLDNLISPDAKIDIIKIDVEGFEPNVLAGAHRVLSENSAVLYIEASTSERKQKIDEMVAPYGYSSVARFNDTPTYSYKKEGA